MGDFPSPSILSTHPPPPPQPPSTKSSLPMLYYGLVVVGMAVVVLTVYNIIVIKWCTQRPPRRPNRFVEVTNASHSFENPNRNLMSSFKYKKDVVAQEQESEFECAVCLSVFEDGDEVRQLPRCKHSFHVSCIDMWLYSHTDCPLCRAPATPLSAHHHLPSSTPENSREGLLDSGTRV